MAYVSQDRKKQLAPGIKAVLKKHGLKGTISVRNYSTLVINISAGSIDFYSNYNETAQKRLQWSGDLMDDSRVSEDGYIQVNHHHASTYFSGAALEALQELIAVANDGNHDKTDIITDYFDVGWYLNINIGQFDKPYKNVA